MRRIFPSKGRGVTLNLKQAAKLKKIPLKRRGAWAYFDEKCRMTAIQFERPDDTNIGWRKVTIIPKAKALYRWEGWTGDD